MSGAVPLLPSVCLQGLERDNFTVSYRYTISHLLRLGLLQLFVDVPTDAGFHCGKL